MEGELWVDKFYIGKNMPTAPVMLNNRIMYYAGLNTNELVKYDIESKKILEKVYIPEKEKCAQLIKDMHIYENYIYMVPGRGGYVYIYDMNTKKIQVIENRYLKHRKRKINIKESVSYNNYIWCLCNEDDVILKIDMENKSIYEIDFSYMKCSSNLGEMCIWEDKIYISGKESECGLVLNLHNDEIKLWEAGANLEYFSIVDGCAYYMICQDNKCLIYKRNILNGCNSLEKEICLSESIDQNAFRYVRRFENKLIFLPYKLPYMISYDTKTKVVEANKLDICILNNLVGKEFGVNNYIRSLYETDDGYIAVMSYKPCIVYLDKSFEINEIFEEDIDMDICNKSQIVDEVMREFLLPGYDNLIEADKKRCVANISLYSVGENIHNYMLNL